MSNYRIIISKAAEKQIASLPKPIANAIVQKINLLANDPRPVNCVKLQGMDHSYRIRSADYRIIYTVIDSQLIVEVIRVGDRKEVYRKK
ncbi:MAG: type II toxin-antitoxin system RelE/ParE family toxin [Bacteroidota bacterium]